jgi:protein-tyrosine phosphatase
MTAHWAPSRHVALDGAVNVRDIGGYRTSNGLQVARGRLFRGDALSQLTGPDLERLDRVGLRTVIDFRTPGEVLLSGADRLPSGVEFVSLPVSGGDLGAVYELIASGDHQQQRRELGDGRAAEFMVELNRGFVTDPRQREAFGAALRLVCSAGRLSLLYHCSGGKDRAGWMTAIVLTALGVPRELVLRDYLLSNDFHRTEYQKLRFDLVKTGIVADPDLLRPIMEQSATYLGAAFEEADRRYGSFGRFVTRGLEVSDAMLGELRRSLLGDLVTRLAPGQPLRRRGPRRRIRSQASREKITARPTRMPMSRSQLLAECAQSGSVKLPGACGVMTLRLAVEATAP